MSRYNKLFIILIILLFFFLEMVLTSRGGYDGYELENYLTAENIVLHGKPYLSQGYQNLPGINNTTGTTPIYPRHAIGQALLDTPFYFLGHISPIKMKLPSIESSKSDIGKLPAIPLILTSFSHILLTLLTGVILWLFVKDLTKSEKVAHITTLGFLFGTIAWPYSAIGLETLITASLLASFYYLWKFDQTKSVSHLTLAGISLSFLINSKYYGFILAMPLLIYGGYILFLNQKTKRQIPVKQLALSSIPLIIGIIIWVWYNYQKSGTFHGLPIGTTSSSFDLLNTLNNTYLYLLSFGKSAFLYSPMIVLSLFSLSSFIKRMKRESILLLFIILALAAFTIPLWFIASDEMWGPRYVVVLTPIAMLIASLSIQSLIQLKWGKVLLAVLFTFAVFIQQLGLSFFGTEPITIAQQAGAPFIEATNYIPQFSPITTGTALYFDTIKTILTGQSGIYQAHAINTYSSAGGQVGELKPVSLQNHDHFISLIFRSISNKKLALIINFVFLLAVLSLFYFLLIQKEKSLPKSHAKK